MGHPDSPPQPRLPPEPTGLPRGEFAHRLILAIGLIAGAVMGLFLLWTALWVFLLAFAGLLFAILLHTVADWLSRTTKLPYGWSCVTVVLLLIGLFGGAAWVMGWRLLEQFRQFRQSLPRSWQQIQRQLDQSEWGRWLLEYFPDSQAVAQQFERLIGVDQVFTSLFGFVTAAIVVLFVGLYGMAQPGLYREGLLRLFPPPRRKRAGEVVDTVVYTLRWWMLGHLCTMSLAGILTGTGLWLVGAPLPFVLAVIAFFAELIPNFGPLLSAVLGLLLAWTEGPTTGLWALGVYLTVQLLESYVILPLINLETIWLPPAVTLITIVLLGLIAGVWGALVAAPLTIAVIVLVKMLYIEDTLGDRTIDVPGEPSS